MLQILEFDRIFTKGTCDAFKKNIVKYAIYEEMMMLIHLSMPHTVH